MPHRVWNQGHRTWGSGCPASPCPSATDSGHHVARLQRCDKGRKLDTGGIVRVSDDVEVGRGGSVEFLAVGRRAVVGWVWLWCCMAERQISTWSTGGCSRLRHHCEHTCPTAAPTPDAKDSIPRRSETPGQAAPIVGLVSQATGSNLYVMLWMLSNELDNPVGGFSWRRENPE